MLGADKLIKNHKIDNSRNVRNRLALNNGCVRIKLTNGEFGGQDVRIILGKINYILKFYGKKCKAIIFHADCFRPKDKLSYIILEVIIYELIYTFKKEVYLQIRTMTPRINTEGLRETLLYDFNGKKCFDNYLNLFNKNKIKKHTFRRMVRASEQMAISELMTDVKSFLKFFDIKREDNKEIARIVSELADNACEHAQSDCLVDIDVAEEYFRKADNMEYYSINICVLNFSEVLLGDQLKEKLLNNKIQKNGRYAELLEAYNYHKTLFDERYCEEHFFALASFQDNISGRVEEQQTGGRGLAELVGELEKRVDQYDCYVLIGQKVICFHPESINRDKNDWIAFNTSNDFMNYGPDDNVITDSDTDLCGTGYNLSLIYKRSDWE